MDLRVVTVALSGVTLCSRPMAAQFAEYGYREEGWSTPEAWFGEDIAALGDVDGDGYGDLVVSAGDMQAAGQHLMRRVEGMLLIAQAKAGARSVATAPTDLIELVRQAYAVAHGTPALGQLAMAPADACFRVLGDPSWLKLLATTLIEIDAAAGAECGALAIAVEPPHYHGMARCVRIESASFELSEMASTELHLVEAILEYHGGTVEPVQGQGIRLVWPTSRVLEVG